MENSNGKQNDTKFEQCVNAGRDRSVHRKASRYSMCQDINLTSVPSVGQRTGSLFTTDRTDRTDLLVEERDQKVCCFPWAYALAAR